MKRKTKAKAKAAEKAPVATTRRRVGPALNWALPGSGAHGDREAWRTTTAHLQAMYPAMSSPSLGTQGTYIGRDLYGAAFVFDPFVVYRDGKASNPNMLLVGDTGLGKSGLIKRLAYRNFVRGRRTEITDVKKGEYEPLVAATGGSTLSLYRGGPTRLNPARPNPDGTPADVLMRGVAGAALRRDLGPEEAAGLDAAVALVTKIAIAEKREPTMPQIVDLLLEPTSGLVQRVRGRDAEEVRGELRKLGLALQTLCEGPMSGMFDGPTTAGVDWNAPVVRCDLSQVGDDTAMGVLMVCWMAFLNQAHAARDAECEKRGVQPAKTLRPNDETYRALRVPGVAGAYQMQYKLVRMTGVANIAAVHQLSNIASGHDDGTAAAKQADSIIADSGITIVFRQADMRASSETVERKGLSSTIGQTLSKLQRDEAFWLVGDRAFLVRHESTPQEDALTYTDAAMELEYELTGQAA